MKFFVNGQELAEQQFTAQLAEKVMGWEQDISEYFDDGEWVAVKIWRCENGKYAAGSSWNPLQDIADAFVLVEKLEELGWTWEMGHTVRGEKYFNISKTKPSGEYVEHKSKADTVQVAICLTAYKAVTGEEVMVIEQ